MCLGYNIQTFNYKGSTDAAKERFRNEARDNFEKVNTCDELIQFSIIN